MRSSLIAILAAALVLSGCDKAQSDKAAIGGTNVPAPKPVEARSGPFGLAIGMPLAELVGTKTETPGLIQITRVPKPHSLIETVFVQAFEETGACFIKGIGFDQLNDGRGDLARGVADDLAGQLETKYGPPTKKVDRCLSEYNCNADYWTMQLNEKGRVYMYVWESTAAKPLPDNIDKLGVYVGATGIDRTYATVEYYGKNNDQCDLLAKKAQAGSL